MIKKSIGLKKTREGLLWYNMLARCRDGSPIQRNQPRYVGCSVDERFKNFQYFAEWCQEQIGFKETQSERFWQLDKDIVIRGNKVYSPETCVFVPTSINTFFCKSEKSRGTLPIGVSYHIQAKKFSSCCNDDKDKKQHLGLHNTPEEAFMVYKLYKEALARYTAEKWQGLVDKRVTDTLFNYKVFITD